MSYTQEELLTLYAESKGDDPKKVKALTPKTDTEEEGYGDGGSQDK